MPPFGLFKKKPSDIASPQESAPMPALEGLSIVQAQELLDSLESAKAKELSTSLIKIKESVLQSLRILDTLAKDMDKENVKLEGLEQKLKSVVEHSKRTIVSSLKREASLELPELHTANDARRFKEKFESMMKHLGEVSGSHSRVLNAFMKKYSSKMKEEFDELTKLLNETRTIIAEFDQNREPIIKCQNMLNSALQKTSSVKVAESLAKNIEEEIEKIEGDLKILESKAELLVASKQYEQASSNMDLLIEAEKKKEEFEAKIKDLFSRLSRAFTRYSYGVTKETERKLRILIDEPWQIFYEENLGPYSSILTEIRRSIESGQIQLKDSEKVLQYLESILRSLPGLQHQAKVIRSEIDTFQGIDVQIFYQAKNLENKIAEYSEVLARERQELDQQRRQAEEKTEEVGAILGRASQIMVQLTGQNYTLKCD